MKIQYIADDYACFALSGIRTVERSHSTGSAAGGSRSYYSLKVVYKGYESRVSYGEDDESCDDMYNQLCAALTQSAGEVRFKG